MSNDRNVPARIKNFTPLVDILVKRYGVFGAAVWGRYWRYAQGPKGICDASFQTIADELGISRRTVIKWAKTLTKDGYLSDVTPDLKHRPHTYAITPKAQIQISISAEVKEDDQVVPDLPPAITKKLKTINWSGALDEIAYTYAQDPELIDRWLDHVIGKMGKLQNPAGYFRSGFRTGQKPNGKVTADIHREYVNDPYFAEFVED